MSFDSFLDRNRNRVAWWVYLLLLGVGVAFLGYSFVGTFAFGLFVYYAARPVFERLCSHASDGVAAGTTLLGFVVPVLAVLVYVAVVGLQDLGSLWGLSPDEYAQLLAPVVNVDALTGTQRDLLTRALQNPGRLRSLPLAPVRQVVTGGLAVLGTVVNAFVHVSLAFAFAYFLLRDGDDVAAWFGSNVAAPGTTGHAYATAVDDDLETVFFGNVLFVLAMSVLAAVVYYGFNALSPPALTIPFAVLLALLTGVSSLIPLVVGKLVYVPLVAYLGVVAARTGGVTMLYPVGLLVVSFLVLDILPQTLLQPYISGRQTHTGIMMFAYLLGPLLLGWYGFFLLPLFVVLVLQAVRIVLTDLLHGEGLTTTVDAATSLGGEPAEADSETASESAAAASDSDAASEESNRGSDGEESNRGSDGEESNRGSDGEETNRGSDGEGPTST